MATQSLAKQHLALIEFLIEKDFKSKFRGSWLGAVWAFLAPTLHYFVICAVVSQFVVDSKIDYVVLFLSGAIPFSFISNTLVRAPWILHEAQQFFRKAPLPKEIFLIEFIIFEFLQSMGVFLALLGLASALGFIHLNWALPATILAFVLGGLMMYGLCTVLSVFAVFFKDAGYVMPVITQTLFFLSPVAYSMAKVPAQWQWLILCNPLTLLIESIRQPIMNGIVEWNMMGGLAIWAMTFLFLGHFVLKTFNDEIILRV